MIQLEKGNPPPALTYEEEQRLADEYEANKGKTVWKHKGIPKALLKTSFGKCAYCEIELSIGSMYCEVEHFEHKNVHSRKVATWDNLLPSCSSCNRSKSTYDVAVEPILNPYRDNPIRHFILKDYRYYCTSDIGKLTQNILGLNKYNQRKARIKVGDKFLDNLDKCSTSLKSFLKFNDPTFKQDALNAIHDILQECQKEAEFSALCASLLHTNPDYKQLVSELQSLALWDDELQRLHDQSLAIALIE